MPCPIVATPPSGSRALPQAPAVRLLVERGADPAIANHVGLTPLMTASAGGHLEIVRFLLGLPSAKATIDRRDNYGQTALWLACSTARGGVVRALLEGGADPTIADNGGTTPMAIAKQEPEPDGIFAEGRRECVAALEVSFQLHVFCPCLSTCFLVK
jgi:ankyrin repeat protein